MNTASLTQAPPLFTDYSLSELHSVKHELKENIRFAIKEGRCLLQLPVFQKNLRRANRVIVARSLKTEAV